jgi:5'-nucleotidase
LSNVTLVDGSPLAATKPYTIIERFGWKIGVISIAEEDWIGTLGCIDPDDIQFTNIIESTNEWSAYLRQEQGCDYIIALTHMRVPNDLLLAEKSTGVDLYLGGHDHVRAPKIKDIKC